MERFRRGVAAIESRPWLALVLLVATLAAGARIPLNLPLEQPVDVQLRSLNPDAQLYYGLADNLLAGVGFEDTTRHEHVMPTIGHPAWLALASGVLGLSPARQAWLSLWASLLLLAAAVRIATRSSCYALAATALFVVYIRGSVWLAGNVETTIVLSNALWLLALALFYRSGFRPAAGVAAGVVLALALWVRPIFLYPLHAATAAALGVAVAVRWRSGRGAVPQLARGWLALLLTAQVLMLAMHGISEVRYGDPRLVTGTYGAWSLYGGNNPHEPPDRVYRTRVRRDPEFHRLLAYFQRADDWQERHEVFMNRVLRYWSEQPGRALHGWVWRLQRFLGFHGDQLATPHNQRLWGPPIHPVATAALLALLAAGLWRVRRDRAGLLATALSLGVVTAALFGAYAAIHALFAYSDFRYVTGSLPLLVGAIAFLAADRWPPPGRAAGAPEDRL